MNYPATGDYVGEYRYVDWWPDSVVPKGWRLVCFRVACFHTARKARMPIATALLERLDNQAEKCDNGRV